MPIPFLPVSIALLLATCGLELRAQGGRNLDHAADVLGDAAANHGPACQVLIRSQHRAVPKLLELLPLDEQTRDETTTLSAMYVAGCLEEHAAAVLPRLRHYYCHGTSAGIRRQALWAIGQVAGATLDSGSESSRELFDFLGFEHASDGDLALLAVVRHRLQYGANATADEIIEGLGADAELLTGQHQALAACESARWLLARERLGAADRQALVDELHSRLQYDLRPLEYSWDRLPYRQAVVPSVAAALRAGGVTGEPVTHGLLRHYDWMLRAEAVQSLVGTAPADLRTRHRATMLLSDPVAAVRDLALATVGSWQADGAVALPLLAAYARGSRSAFSAGCRVAGRRIAGQAGNAIAAVWQQLLQDGTTEPTRLPAAAGARERHALIQMVHGCSGWSTREILVLARAVADSDGITKPIANAFVSCLGCTDHNVERATLRALERLGPTLSQQIEHLPTLVIRSTALNRVPSFIAAQLEAFGRAGPAATPAELLTAVQSGPWYVARRALVEYVGRPTPDAGIDREIARLPQRSWRHVRIHQGRNWSTRRGGGWRQHDLPVDHDDLLACACLARLAHGHREWRDHRLLDAAAAALQVPRKDIETELQAAAQLGRLPQLAAKIEGHLAQPWWRPK